MAALSVKGPPLYVSDERLLRTVCTVRPRTGIDARPRTPQRWVAVNVSKEESIEETCPGSHAIMRITPNKGKGRRKAALRGMLENGYRVQDGGR